jgi:hypothetical protein
MNYKLGYLDLDGNTSCILVVDENNKTKMAIPLDPNNTDYQEYLEWVAEGNTPEAAE